MLRTWCLFLLLCLLLLPGCAQKSGRPVSFFAGKDITLIQDNDDPEYWYWERPGIRYPEYTAFLIEPVRIQLQQDDQGSDISPEDLHELAEYLRNEVMDTLQPTYRIVSKPAAGVMRIRTVITNIIPTNALLNVVSTATLFFPIDMGGAGMEAEFSDSLTGERLAVIVSHKRGKPYNLVEGYTPYSHAKGVFEIWAADLKEALDAVYTNDNQSRP